MAGFIIDGVWYPTNVEKQIAVFNVAHRYLLLEGARRSGKSVAALHKVYRHLYDCSFAKVAIVSRTKNNGKRGAWADLIGSVYRTWNEAGLVEFIDGTPAMEGDTKVSYFRIRNRHGTVSECQLHSIDYDDNVEDKFKDTRFSMIYMIEADRFDEIVFATLCQQLRSLEVPYEQQQFLLDTNPPEEGEDHWLHRRFFNPPADEDMDDWRVKYKAIHFDLDDNPYLTDAEKKDLYRDYQHDPAKLARYYYGKWVRDASNGLFADVFNFNIHVIGEWNEDLPEDDQELLRPAPKTYAIDVGMDVGDVNTSIHFGVPRFADPTTLCYDIIDEIAFLGERIPLTEITELIEGRMDYWEEYCKRQLGLQSVLWRFWSDPSSMRYKAAPGSTEANLINVYSKGRIDMTPVTKGEGSVKVRLDMLRRMLFEERVFISARCVKTVDMLRSLKKGKSQNHIIDRASRYKHAFDSLTYMLSGAMPEEISGMDSSTSNEKTSSMAVAIL